MSEATFTIYAGADGCGRAGQPWIRRLRCLVEFENGSLDAWLTSIAWELDRNLSIRLVFDVPVMSPELWHGEWLGFYRECWGTP